MSAAREVLAADAEAPVAAIADRAGVSRATFYRHFGSRRSLLRSVQLEPRPDARSRVLAAAKDMLLTTSLDALSMEDLARAAGVSRGTLYRIVPGKGPLLAALIQRYSPFEAVRNVVDAHADDPPEVVLPMIGQVILGVAGERLGLMRAVFHEVTARSGLGADGSRSLFEQTLGLLARYMQRQMDAGRIRSMHPVLALHAVVGPLFFHLMTRSTLEEVVELPDPGAAIDTLVLSALEGLRP